jgi:hypothetical protein
MDIPTTTTGNSVFVQAFSQTDVGDGAGTFDALSTFRGRINFDISITVTDYFSPPMPVTNGPLDYGDSANWGNGAVPNSACAAAAFPDVGSPVTIALPTAGVTLGTLVFDSPYTYTIDGPGSLTIYCPDAGGQLFVAQGSHVINATTYLNSDTDFEIPQGSVLSVNALQATSNNIVKGGQGMLTVNAVNANSLTINDGTVQINTQGTPRNDANTVSIVSNLTIAGGPDNWEATFDLNDSDLIIHNGDLATVTNQIKSGFNLAGGGHWDGPGITSSAAAMSNSLTALGVISNLQGGSAFYSTFDGQSVYSTDILVKYTYFGDANLDGVVNGSDYTLIDNGFNSQGTASPLTGWFNGDFNYDGVINGDDYMLIDNAFNMQSGSLAVDSSDVIAGSTEQIAGPVITPIPEPTAAVSVAMVIGGLGICRRVRAS